MPKKTDDLFKDILAEIAKKPPPIVRQVRSIAKLKPVHRLSVAERKARRVRNQARAQKAAERLSGASSGRSTWLHRSG